MASKHAGRWVLRDGTWCVLMRGKHHHLHEGSTHKITTQSGSWSEITLGPRVATEGKYSIYSVVRDERGSTHVTPTFIWRQYGKVWLVSARGPNHADHVGETVEVTKRDQTTVQVTLATVLTSTDDQTLYVPQVEVRDGKPQGARCSNCGETTSTLFMCRDVEDSVGVCCLTCVKKRDTERSFN